MIPVTVDWCARAIGATTRHPSATARITRVWTDTRTLEPGDLFVALRGPNFDGHNFVPHALAKGAVGCVCDRTFAASTAPPDACLIVDDTLTALGRMAAEYRLHVLPESVVILAVTGSNGKTTTKCMIDHVLRGSFKGRPSPKSYNNAIGVPLTLLAADADDRYVVAEVGSNAPGEIARLASIVLPYVAVITSIGEAHLEGLGNLDSVAVEKTSILRYVRPSGFGVVNVDRPEILTPLSAYGKLRTITFGLDAAAKLRVTRRRADLSGTTFELEGRYRIELPMPGPHHATNAAATFAVARWFGLPPEVIIERLATFSPPEGRTSRFAVAGVTVVDDAYNANPSSVGAAIETLRTVREGRRILVLGDMLELGPDSEDAHARVLHLAEQAGLEVIVGVGSLMETALGGLISGSDDVEYYTCRDADEAGGLLEGVIRAGDTVWIKGSRGVGLDRTVAHLRRVLPARASAKQPMAGATA